MADLMTHYNDPNLEAARAAASGAASTATSYQSAASMLPAKLKEAIQGKLDYNQDLIKQRNDAASKYFASGSVNREKYQDIFNPFTRESLVAQSRGQDYNNYANLSDLLTERRGSITDLVNAGTGAFNSSVNAQQGNAALSRQTYEDLLGMADKKTALDLALYKENNSSAASAMSPLDKLLQEAIAKKLLGGSVEESGYPPPPMTSARPDVEVEYPVGSGVFWVGDGMGGWK
jgi:hypothetical protein